MHRLAITAVVLAMGMACEATAQTTCACGPLNPPPVALSAGAVNNTGGTASLSLAPRPLVSSNPSGALAPLYVGRPGYVTYRPLIPIAPMPASYYVGRGILGQPTLYVPGQPVRNFLRYLAP